MSLHFSSGNIKKSYLELSNCLFKKNSADWIFPSTSPGISAIGKTGGLTILIKVHWVFVKYANTLKYIATYVM